ncbi:MAG: OmpA family protein [Proteobacteria bacterium]|nr:OmpA family protein [Pseudomonadota bacterium]
MHSRVILLPAGLFAATALLAPGARAQPIQGLYIGAGAGYTLPSANTDATGYGAGFSTGTPPAGGALNLKQRGGFAGVISMGYGIGNGFRFEVEGSIRQNGVDHVGGTNFPTVGSGNTRTLGLMANALYDADVGLNWMYPYVGVGAGYAWTHLHNVSAAAALPSGTFLANTDDTAGRFAWQAIVGASFPIAGIPWVAPNLPGLSLTAEYRFMDVTGGGKYDTQVLQAGSYSNSTLKLHNQFYNTFLVGLRYQFGAASPPPAPAPVAAPAPAPSRSYLVFFDWDKATLSDRARQIIAEAAQNSTKVQYTRIEVNGYTDTSGSPKYNMGLSIRRAQAVAGELVRDGVPKSAIAIQGFGQTRLLVPTADGVREPQNRRVEIIIR